MYVHVPFRKACAKRSHVVLTSNCFSDLFQEFVTPVWTISVVSVSEEIDKGQSVIIYLVITRHWIKTWIDFYVKDYILWEYTLLYMHALTAINITTLVAVCAAESKTPIPSISLLVQLFTVYLLDATFVLEKEIKKILQVLCFHFLCHDSLQVTFPVVAVFSLRNGHLFKEGSKIPLVIS